VTNGSSIGYCVSIVGAFMLAILTFVLTSMISSIHDERLRVDEILRKQANVEAVLAAHIEDHVQDRMEK
jgi:hypothetical protein